MSGSGHQSCQPRLRPHDTPLQEAASPDVHILGQVETASKPSPHAVLLQDCLHDKKYDLPASHHTFLLRPEAILDCVHQKNTRQHLSMSDEILFGAIDVYPNIFAHSMTRPPPGRSGSIASRQWCNRGICRNDIGHVIVRLLVGVVLLRSPLRQLCQVRHIQMPVVANMDDAVLAQLGHLPAYRLNGQAKKIGNI